MIPLIPCSDSDAERYYRETIVFVSGQPHIFNRKEGRAAHLINQQGNSCTVPYDTVRQVVLPPFYTNNGEWVGNKTQRSTRRGEVYSRRWFDDILSLLNTGDVPRTDNRINKDWYMKRVRGVTIMMYRGSVVGFRSIKTGEYLLQDAVLVERLQKLLGDSNVIRSFV